MKYNEEELQSIRDVYLFEALEEAQFEKVMSNCHKIELPSKQTLFEAGQVAENFYLLNKTSYKSSN